MLRVFVDLVNLKNHNVNANFLVLWKSIKKLD